MITENLSTLKIHKLTQEQYDRALAAGNIDESAMYLTPDDSVITEYDIEKTYEEQQVYSANAVNGMFEALKAEIQGDLDEIGDLVGGEDDGVYRINGFAYYEDMECYIAPIDSFPDVEAGIYRITINGETVDGSVSRYTDESGSEVVYIASNGTPKIWLMLMGGGDFSESEENYLGSFGMAQSLYPVEETVELKFIKSEDMVDWGVYIEASYDEGSACYHAYFELDNFDKNAEATYDFAMYDSNNNLIYNPSSRLLNTGYNESAGMFSSFDNGIGNEEYEVIRNSMDTNSPIKFVFTQTLENGVVNTKTVSGVPVIRNDIIYHEGKEFYCWGNIDAFIVGA